MGTQTAAPGFPPLVARLEPFVTLTDGEFFRLCQDNRDLRLERSPRGEILIMPPTGGETGRRSMRIAGQLGTWTAADGTGVAFVIELRSTSDRRSDLEAKMHEYQEAGVKLGWLIDPLERCVLVYRQHEPVLSLEQPPRLDGSPLLPRFVLELDAVWQAQ